MDGWTVTWCTGCVILFILSVMLIHQNNKLYKIAIEQKKEIDFWYDKFADEHNNNVMSHKGGNMKKKQGKLEMRKSKDRQWYFVMVASNNKIMGVSEMYTTEFNCKRAILAFEKYVWKIK